MAGTDPQNISDWQDGQVLLSNTTSLNFDEAMEARIGDALWFLARQWQTGEFEAENGGSLAYMDVAWESTPMQTVTRGGASEALDLDAPLDWVVEREDANGQSAAWREEALEYEFSATCGEVTLKAEEYDGHRLDWFHFDIEKVAARSTVAQGGEKSSRRVVPNNVAFDGMPHPRWWRFEEEDTHVAGAFDAEPNVLSLVLPEFLNLDTNNWYLIPIDQKVGHMRKVTGLRAVDGFGIVSELEPIVKSWSQEGWQVFSLNAPAPARQGRRGQRRRGANNGADLFIPNVGAEVHHSDILEEVLFVRDEQNNLVWAMERLVRDANDNLLYAGDGEDGADGASLAAASQGGQQSFKLRSDLADYWIPYVPRFIAATSALNGETYLRRARSKESADQANPQYKTELVAQTWRLNEEEIPRYGLRAQRLMRYVRGSDGKLYRWTGRRKDPVVRPPLPGLEFDFIS